MSNTTLSPFQPDAMTPAQLAAVSYLVRCSSHTYQLYAAQSGAHLLGVEVKPAISGR